AMLEVRDHGIGIAPDAQERIFQPFERAVPSREISGFGLGLYISRQIVEAHGGSLTVESAPGRGSTFTVRLPCSAPGQVVESSASPSTLTTTSTITSTITLTPTFELRRYLTGIGASRIRPEARATTPRSFRR